MIQDEKVSVTLLDDAIPVSDPYLKSRGTGVDEGCTHSDLAISGYSISDMVTAGTPLQVVLTVKNMGLIPSDETAIGVRLSKGQILLRPTEMIPPLTPGEEREVTVTVTVPQDLDGAGIVTIILDPDNTEEECNEYNNEESENIRILSPGISPDDYMDKTAPLPASASSGGGSGGGGSFPSDTP